LTLITLHYLLWANHNTIVTVIHLLSKYLSCSICFALKVCSDVGSGRLLLDPFISQFSIVVVLNVKLKPNNDYPTVFRYFYIKNSNIA